MLELLYFLEIDFSKLEPNKNPIAIERNIISIKNIVLL